MTEEEAKEKWCPFTRVGFWINAPDDSFLATSGNRMTPMNDECNCIASGCMAWRWSRKDFKNLPRSEWYGYCGLAGEG